MTPPAESDLSDTVAGMVKMSATEASRSFSDLLNRVAGGEEFEITRAGATVAVIAPARSRMMSPARFRELMASLPTTDDDFLDDLQEIRRSVGPPPSGDPWES
jgi:prevent-host-death family protein